MHRNRTVLREKIKESVTAVLPVMLIVLALCFVISPVPNFILLLFLFGGLLLIVGMGLFTLGADLAMQPMGEYIGARVTGSRKLSRVLPIAFFVGLLITISEPDLSVLAEQVPTIDSTLLIIVVGIGVGVFLTVAMLRIFLGIKLRYLLIGFYAVVFILAGCLFVYRPQFLAVAFDSGGVTTGPMTVPFLMALGIGVSSVRSDGDTSGDSFGLVAFSSVGPILAVMVLGLVLGDGEIVESGSTLLMPENSRELGLCFISQLPKYMWEIVRAVAPITVFFFVYQFCVQPLDRHRILKISVGVGYTFVGLVLFLLGANVGFSPMGTFLGDVLGGGSLKYIVIPIGMLIGYVTVRAEPAVHVLAHQVEEATSGAIPRKTLMTALEIGVALSVGLAFARVMFGVPLLYLVLPGYLLALAMTFFVPPLFTSIAFDAGGVASGPMTATFLLPFAIGLCRAVGGDPVEDAFGVVAMVAMTPLITVQLLGVVYRLKPAVKVAEQEAEEEIVALDEEIIEF